MLRVSDILNLKVKDVLNTDNTIKDRLIVKEIKTKKIKDIVINSKLKDILTHYLKSLDYIDYTDYLFKSPKTGRALDRMTIYYMIKRVCKVLGITDNIATHSMRKTGSTAIYNQTKDIYLVSKLLNHSSTVVTQRYLRIDRETLDNSVENMII